MIINTSWRHMAKQIAGNREPDLDGATADRGRVRIAQGARGRRRWRGFDAPDGVWQVDHSWISGELEQEWPDGGERDG